MSSKGIAVALADGNVASSFLTLFGRSARVTGMENERVNELASTQWLHMLNSATIQNKLQNGPKLKAMIAAMAEWPWREWAGNARRMYEALLEEGFAEPQALIIVGQMVAGVLGTSKK